MKALVLNLWKAVTCDLCLWLWIGKCPSLLIGLLNKRLYIRDILDWQLFGCLLDALSERWWRPFKHIYSNHVSAFILAETFCCFVSSAPMCDGQHSGAEESYIAWVIYWQSFLFNDCSSTFSSINNHCTGFYMEILFQIIFLTQL